MGLAPTSLVNMIYHNRRQSLDDLGEEVRKLQAEMQSRWPDLHQAVDAAPDEATFTRLVQSDPEYHRLSIRLGTMLNTAMGIIDPCNLDPIPEMDS